MYGLLHSLRGTESVTQPLKLEAVFPHLANQTEAE